MQEIEASHQPPLGQFIDVSEGVFFELLEAHAAGVAQIEGGTVFRLDNCFVAAH